MEKYSNQDWSNWSGDLHFRPAITLTPANEQELQLIVQRAITRQQTIRAIGARHSCSTIFSTDQVLLVTERFKGLHHYDTQLCQATLGAGMTVEEVGDALFETGMGMENTGHINKQVMAGAISTGTHGAGKKLCNLSAQIIAARMVTGTGEIMEFSKTDHPEIFQALKVSLGSLGIFTSLTLQALPRFQLHRRQYCASTADCLHHLPQLMEENRNFCFYWYPRRDDVSIRLWNLPGEGTTELPFAKLYKEFTGWGKDVLPSDQQLKFNELEYSIELDAAPDCFQEIRRRILQKHRAGVAWRVLYRPVAADDAWLSNAYGKNIVAITIHQHASLSYKEYFDDIEKIFRAFGGRPHWGKKHTMKAAELRSLYPKWEQFQKLRQRFDPHGIFLNTYLKDVFIGQNT